MKILQILLAAILVVALAGCEFLDNLRDSIRQQLSKTTESVTQKVEEVGKQIEETKESVEQKVEDVKNAAKEVKEAVDAVQKVTGDGEQK